MPGAAKAREKGSKVFESAATGAARFMTRTSQFTTSSERVVKAYDKKGHQVSDLADIRNLDLRVIDKVAAFRRLQYAYAGSVAVEGAASGFAVSGGQALAAFGSVAGAGAGAAPGLATVTAAMGADVAAVLTACSRVVAHVALYYGYDPLDPAEEVFMMQAIGLGVAGTAGGKVVAYQQLAVLAQGLARNAAWSQLNKQTLTKVAQKFATSFGQKLTKKKLGQLVPIAGIGINAALNYKMVDDVPEAAFWAYRERLLREKGAEILDVTLGADQAIDDDDVIDVVEILQDVEGIDDISNGVDGI
ncbi:EcsC family protein [Gordonia polyisoprenivorans]|uniref:EcsC family protein n=1 Tax=Gordonia polyisoprenivorans TaxID=84595 RepID=UPI0030CD5038